jgi:hypothetical protein
VKLAEAPFCLGGFMPVRALYLFSLLLILLLTPFVLADSIPARGTAHSGLTARTAFASQKEPSADAGLPANFASIDRASSVAFRVVDLSPNGDASFSQTTAFSPNQFGQRHGTISYPIAGWRVWREQPLAAPEPGSLLLVSSGLFGIAGLVRRTFKGQLLKNRPS